MNEQRPAFGFGVIPRFVIAGAFSAAYWLIVLQKSELHHGSIDVLTVLLGSCFLGLTITTVLWLYGRMPSWRSAALLVGMVTIANGATAIACHPPERFEQDQDLLLLTQTILFLGACLFIFPAFALVLRYGRSAIRVLAAAFVSAGIAGFAFFYVVRANRGGMINVLPGNALGVVWQIGFTSFLGASLWAGDLVAARTHDAEPARRQELPRQGTRNALIAVAILVTFGILVQIWAQVMVAMSHE